MRTVVLFRAKSTCVVTILPVFSNVASYETKVLKVGGCDKKDNPGKLILFETSYLSLQLLLKSLNDDDTGIATQVDLKTSTLKPLYAYLDH